MDNEEISLAYFKLSYHRRHFDDFRSGSQHYGNFHLLNSPFSLVLTSRNSCLIIAPRSYIEQEFMWVDSQNLQLFDRVVHTVSIDT